MLLGEQHFEEICRRLRAAGAETSGQAFVEFRDMVFETCVTALETLVAAGELGTGGVAVFAVSGTDDPLREAAWIRRLNPAAEAGRSARWLGSGA